MRFSLPSATVIQRTLLGAVCMVGAFAIGLETAGNIHPFHRTEAALNMQGERTVIRGDVNGDGELTAKDASLLLEFAEGLSVPSTAEVRRGDTDHDGSITHKDVLRVLHALSTRS